MNIPAVLKDPDHKSNTVDSEDGMEKRGDASMEGNMSKFKTILTPLIIMIVLGAVLFLPAG